MLVFPTSKGKFYEWEDRGMVGALWESLEQGHIQLYCVDNERDTHRLEQLKKIDILLTTAWDDSIPYSTEALSQTLWAKNIWHAKRVWDGIFLQNKRTHDWPWWQRQIQMYLGGHD